MASEHESLSSMEILDEGGMAFAAERTKVGALSILVRVYGGVVIDGVEYEYDRNVRIALKRKTDDGHKNK